MNDGQTAREFTAASGGVRVSGLDEAVLRACEALLGQQHRDGHWVFELEADATISSEYILLQHYLDREGQAVAAASTLRGTGTDHTTKSTSCWNMAWALDEDERPPPSSIVARRDTEEALKLARIADKAVLASERTLSANNLWNVIISFLMASPEERKKGRRTSPLPGHSPKLKAKGTTHVVGAGRKTSLRSFLGRMAGNL